MGQGAAALRVRVLTLPVAGLEEAAVEPLLAVLDAAERQRAARFAFARNRVEFTAAHALARAALATATGAPAASLGFAAGPHGKPEALLADGRAAPASFNLSHTEGVVGVAVAAAPGLRLGFDLEPLTRRVSPAVAEGVFRPEELAWLAARPGEAGWREGFLRLWTLKEAFIKATGRGLAQGLQSFWFLPEDAGPPRLRLPQGAAERAEDWVFDQRRVPGGALGAVGLHRPAGQGATAFAWESLDLPALRLALSISPGAITPG